MITTLILFLSLAALFEFFVSYCRSLVVVYSKVELSPQARRMAELEDREVRGEEFHRILQLVRLCPEPGDDHLELRAVRTYYSLLGLLRSIFMLAAARGTWVERERAACAYFAAVALDRRMASRNGGIT
jgi:hypothetical protein